MLPPLVRRCPDCGHVGLVFGFERVDGGERRECPDCGHRFRVLDRPWLS